MSIQCSDCGYMNSTGNRTLSERLEIASNDYDNCHNCGHTLPSTESLTQVSVDMATEVETLMETVKDLLSTVDKLDDKIRDLERQIED